VFLHNGNKFPSIPLVHAAHMKEKYENLQVLLLTVCYEENLWNTRADLTAVAMLTVLKGGYTKFYSF